MEKQEFILKASKRSLLGKKVKSLRAKGLIPAVVYGRGFKNEPISLNQKEFQRVFRDAGSSALVDLEIGEAKPVKVLIHEPERHPVTEAPLHADLYRVRMDEEIRTEIPLVIIGEAPAVLELEGTLSQNKDSLEVETLPANLVPEIEVDVSNLKTFEDEIRVSDVKVPTGIKVLTDPEEVVVSVTPPRSEEEMAELEEQPAAEEEAALAEELNKAPEEETKESGPEGESQGE